MLAVKAAAIAALYFAFFAGSHRPHVTPQTMTALISGPVPPATR
ncbi:cytochrome oxidase putative small subunit CydP [Methylocystis bryophila]